MEQVLSDLVKYCSYAGDKGLTPGISGNVSARYNDDFYITVSGSASGYLDKDKDVVLINKQGELISKTSQKPSSERFLHLEFYKMRPDINAIFHVHSPYLTAFASSATALEEPISPEIVYCFGKIPLAEYALPGSDELVKKTSKYFTDYDIILMENHGVIVGGTSIKDAYLKLELAEAYAKTIICSKILGGAKTLPPEEVKKIYELR